MYLSRALPSDLSEQLSQMPNPASCVSLLELAARSMLVSPAIVNQCCRMRLVSVAVTKHYCLTAVNRCGALCCPDFPLPACTGSDKPTNFRI